MTSNVDNDLKRAAQFREKLEAILELDHLFKQHAGYYERVPVFSYLEAAAFFNEYFYSNRPVLVKNWTNGWTALGKWTLEYFKETFGEEPVEITYNRDSSKAYEMDIEKFKKQIPLKEYIDLILANPQTNNYYLVARNFLLGNKNFSRLFDDFAPIPEIIDPSTHNDKGYVKIWIGPGGTITPLHHDRVNVLLVQIKGRKLVKLIPPNQIHKVYNYYDVYSELDLDTEIDPGKYPKAKDLKILEITVNPGEALLIPVGWWHWVKSLDVSITLTHQQFCIEEGNILLLDDYE
jgi:Cupin-like domain